MIFQVLNLHVSCYYENWSNANESKKGKAFLIHCAHKTVVCSKHIKNLKKKVYTVEKRRHEKRGRLKTVVVREKKLKDGDIEVNVRLFRLWYLDVPKNAWETMNKRGGLKLWFSLLGKVLSRSSKPNRPLQLPKKNYFPFAFSHKCHVKLT